MKDSINNPDASENFEALLNMEISEEKVEEYANKIEEAYSKLSQIEMMEYAKQYPGLQKTVAFRQMIVVPVGIRMPREQDELQIAVTEEKGPYKKTYL